MINHITIVGNLTRDPKHAVTKSNLEYTQLNIAVSTTIRRKDKEPEQEVCYIDCTLWGKESIAAKSLRKGSEVMVSGRLKLEVWPDKATGLERSKHTIHVEKVIHSGKLEDDVDHEEQVAAIPSRQAELYPKPQARPSIKPPQDDYGMPF